MRIGLIVWLVFFVGLVESNAQQGSDQTQAAFVLQRTKLKPALGVRSLRIDQLFYETANGRVLLPREVASSQRIASSQWTNSTRTADGRIVTLAVRPQGNNFTITFKAQPEADIIRWGRAIQSTAGEYYTGVMERVVDGPQPKSWAPGITEAMDLRGQRVEMIIKPTTSIYAPSDLKTLDAELRKWFENRK